MADRATFKDFTPVIIAYLVAFAVAAICVMLLPLGLLLKTLLADVAATLVIFAFSRAYKNSSFYDAYWSVVPPVIGIYWWLSAGAAGADDMRIYLVLCLVIWWAARLTINWANHWEGMSHEDWRYQPIRDKAGKNAAFADLAGIHMFPTLIVFAACLPLYAVTVTGTRPLNALDIIALVVTAGAILTETISDIQLHKFIKTKKPGEFIKTGLWRYSRHPNYFGELGFWVGLMLFGLAAYPSGWWWIMPGAIMIGLMFVFVSIPLMDERSRASRKGYDAHMKSVSGLMPWFPK